MGGMKVASCSTTMRTSIGGRRSCRYASYGRYRATASVHEAAILSSTSAQWQTLSVKMSAALLNKRRHVNKNHIFRSDLSKISSSGRNKSKNGRGGWYETWTCCSFKDDSKKKSALGDHKHRTARRMRPKHEYNGVFILLLVNFVIFILDKQLGYSFISQYLYLNHSSPMPWQFLTAIFCHSSWEHFSQNGIMLYLFGRIVEEDEGTASVIAAYLLTGAVAMLADLLFIPSQMGSQSGGFLPVLFKGAQQAKVAVVSVGASGAVFGTSYKKYTFVRFCICLCKDVISFNLFSITGELG